MHVGGDYHSVAGGPRADMTAKANLEYNLRHGVKHLTAQIRSVAKDGAWDSDELKTHERQLRPSRSDFRSDPNGLRLHHAAKRLGSRSKARRDSGEYSEGFPGRRKSDHSPLDGDTDSAKRAGTRVGAELPTKPFKLEDNWKDLPVGEAGRVTSDDYWERITYFLHKVIPVCKQYDVKMAAHPYDPPGLPFGYQGAENWDSPSIFDGYKRYEAIVDSPYNGFQLCLGTTAEGLEESGHRRPSDRQILGRTGENTSSPHAQHPRRP